MKNLLKVLLVAFIILQFFRIDKTNPPVDKKMDFLTIKKTPENLSKMIKSACYDCHSNETVYPWYAEIAPVSWYLASHVNDGKEHLNFSEWTAYNVHQKEHILKDLKEVMESHEMPLKSYLLLHENAKMNKNQYEAFSKWLSTIEIQ